MPREGPVGDLIRRRRSIRRYLEEPVDRELIRECLEAARLAPSAENVQPWRFVVVDEPELRARVCDAAFSGIYFPTRWARQAPVLLVFLARLDFKANRLGAHLQGVQFYLLDLGAAGQQLALRALELGLGTCWIGWFNGEKVREVLKIPRRYHVVALMTLGRFADGPRHEKARLPLEEIAWFNEAR